MCQKPGNKAMLCSRVLTVWTNQKTETILQFHWLLSWQMMLQETQQNWKTGIGMDLTGTVSYLIMIVHAGQVSPALITSDFYQSLQRDIFLNPQSTNFKKDIRKASLVPRYALQLTKNWPTRSQPWHFDS